MHLTVERGGKLLLQIGTEAIDINKQWNGDDDKQKYADDDPRNDE